MQTIQGSRAGLSKLSEEALGYWVRFFVAMSDKGDVQFADGSSGLTATPVYWTHVSMSKLSAPDLTARVASVICALREAKGLSLDGLAGRSGVSRSMISLIERAQASPTAVVLDKLARALGVTLASLFDQAAPNASTPPTPVSRRADRIFWRDPDSGYVRSNVSPAGTPQPMQLVEVKFPAGARVTFENGARGARILQQLWVLTGAINITLGEDRHALREGDCLAMELDRPTMLHNPTRKVTRYALVIATETLSRR